MHYRLPDGCAGVSIAGIALDPVAEGIVEAEASAAAELAPHDILPIEPETAGPRETSPSKKRPRP